MALAVGVSVAAFALVGGSLSNPSTGIKVPVTTPSEPPPQPVEEPFEEPGGGQLAQPVPEPRDATITALTERGSRWERRWRQ